MSESGAVTVLAIDDDPVDLMAVQRHLRQAADRFHLLTCNSINDALPLLRREQPAAIISDHNLGPDNSLRLLEELRRRGISIPVVVLTGQGDEAVAVQVLTAGAVDYLRKDQLDPLRLDHTLTRIISAAAESDFAERARQALHTLATGTAHLTGTGFFTALVHHLATALQAQACWVAIHHQDQAEVISGWRQPGDDLSNSTYPLAGSPCVDALMSEQVHRCQGVMMTLNNSQGPATLAGSYHGFALRDHFNRTFGTLVIISDQAAHDLVDSLLRICGERTCSEWNRLQTQRDQQAEYARQRAIAGCCQELFWNRQPSKTLDQAISLVSRELGAWQMSLWHLDGMTGRLVAGQESNQDSGSPVGKGPVSADLQRQLQQQSPATIAGVWHLPIIVTARVWGWLAVADYQALDANGSTSVLSLRDQNCLAQIGDLIGHYLSQAERR